MIISSACHLKYSDYEHSQSVSNAKQLNSFYTKTEKENKYHQRYSNSHYTIGVKPTQGKPAEM